jgi:hypothetical protein
MIFTIHFNQTMLVSGRAGVLLNGYRLGDELQASRVFVEYFLDVDEDATTESHLHAIWEMANVDDRPNPEERKLSPGDTISLLRHICPAMYSVEPIGFKQLHCSCEWADDGHAESGPSPYIRERHKLCPIHGMNTHGSIAEEVEV